MGKGQLISMEVLSVFVIFLIMFSIFQVQSTQLFWRAEQNLNEKAYLLAFQTAQMLSTSRGSPVNWNVNNVEYIGIASKRNVIDPQKAKMLFNQLNYNDRTRSLLPGGAFETYISLRNASSGNLIIIDGQTAEYGVSANRTAFAASVRTPVVYLGQSCFLDVILWR